MERSLQQESSHSPYRFQEPPFEVPAMQADALCAAYMQLTETLELTPRDAVRVLASVGKMDPVPAAPAPQPRTDCPEYKMFERWQQDNPHLWPLRTEMNLWSHEHQLAGQLDALFYDAKEKIVTVLDHKRAKSMDFEAFGGRCGKPPCDDMQECNFSHYSIQARLYSTFSCCII